MLTVFAILPILCTLWFRNGSHHMISRKTSIDSFGHLQSVGNVEEQYKDDSGDEHDAAGIEPDNVKVHLDGSKEEKEDARKRMEDEPMLCGDFERSEKVI